MKKSHFLCQTVKEGYTIADNGSTGSSVIDSAHGLVTFRPSSVLRLKETHEVTNKWLTSIYKDHSNSTYPYSQRNHFVTDIEGFCNKRSPYSLNRQKKIITSSLATSYQVIVKEITDISGRWLYLWSWFM